MKRSIFRTAAALFCAVACVCGLAACAKGEQKKAVENITLSKTELALEIGGEETLTATVTPEDASEKTVTWSVSPAGIATVSDGKVTAVAESSATVTATAGGKSATCSVTVKAPEKTPEIVPVRYTVTKEEWETAMNLESIPNLTIRILSVNGTEVEYRDLFYDNGKWHDLFSENGPDGAKELISEHYYQITGGKTETGTYPGDYYYKEGNAWMVQKNYQFVYFDSDGFIRFATGIVFDDFRFNEEKNVYECEKGTIQMPDGSIGITNAEAAFEDGKLIRVKISGESVGDITMEVSDYGTTTVTLPDATAVNA